MEWYDILGLVLFMCFAVGLSTWAWIYAKSEFYRPRWNAWKRKWANRWNNWFHGDKQAAEEIVQQSDQIEVEEIDEAATSQDLLKLQIEKSEKIKKAEYEIESKVLEKEKKKEEKEKAKELKKKEKEWSSQEKEAKAKEKERLFTKSKAKKKKKEEEKTIKEYDDLN